MQVSMSYMHINGRHSQKLTLEMTKKACCALSRACAEPLMSSSHAPHENKRGVVAKTWPGRQLHMKGHSAADPLLPLPNLPSLGQGPGAANGAEDWRQKSRCMIKTCHLHAYIVCRSRTLSCCISSGGCRTWLSATVDVAKPF